MLPALLLSYGVTALLSAALSWLLAHWWNPAQVVMALLVLSLAFYTVIFCYLISRPQPGPALLLAAMMTALAGGWLWQ
ncbi:hypothetical protein GCM10011297_02420 [Bacterioplanes sanyensis]|uniref:hypothetical protein n=1 Tax=Bacterioplanes sanyensis TaxID=1249553 RepID=UPI00167B47F9|nr:hypothetical protein [Bacterioplanes sanyensis]GGY32993.1 hypothetical protein GCM10011297_02420 [Bacterioplanes sanyensis]